MSVRFRPLADVAEIFIGLPTKISRFQGIGAIPVLSVRALGDRGIERNELIHADVGGRSVEGYCVRSGDVVIPARSTSLKAAVTPPELEGTPMNATLIGVRCGPELDPHLLVAYLCHPDGLTAVAEHAQSGTAQMNITVKALSQLLVPVPPREKQRMLVEMLQAADVAFFSAVDAARRRKKLAMDIILTRMTEVAKP